LSPLFSHREATKRVSRKPCRVFQFYSLIKDFILCARSLLSLPLRPLPCRSPLAAEDAAAEAEAETTEMEANIENESMNEAAAD